MEKHFKNLLCLLCMSLAWPLYAQTYLPEKPTIQFHLKEEYPSLITSFLAGAFEGTGETLKWHYFDFEKIFPRANKNYWDPEHSWKNKYKNGLVEEGPKFPGANTFLVWTTDGYHAVKFGRNMMLTTTLALHPFHKKRKWYDYAIDMAVHTLAYQIGFHSTYSVAFKR